MSILLAALLAEGEPLPNDAANSLAPPAASVSLRPTLRPTARPSEHVTVIPDALDRAALDGLFAELPHGHDIITVRPPRKSGLVPKELPLAAALRKLCGD